jgi:hypothetical protein
VLTLDEVPEAVDEPAEGEGDTAEADDAQPLLVPTLLELDARLEVTRVLPLRLGREKQAVPILSWGLDCTEGCRAFAALDESPSRVVDLDLQSAKSPADDSQVRAMKRLVLTTSNPGEPRTDEIFAMASMPSVADLAVSQKGSRLAMVHITEFDPTTPLVRLTAPGPDGRQDPLQATVELRMWDKGQPLPAPAAPISLRARSMGGVSVSWAQSGAEAVVGWTAMDAGQPQVFVTRVDAQGKKLGQRMVTHKVGELGDVVVGALEGGWVVAWVDARSGSPEVYASTLTRTLERRGDERRLSTIVGNPTDLALWPSGNQLVVLWTDAGNPESVNRGAIHARRILATTGEPVGEEWNLVPSARNAYGLVVSPVESGAVLTWVQRVEQGASGPAAEARVARVDAAGKVLWGPETVVIPRGTPVGSAMDCSTPPCVGAVTADDQSEGLLAAFSFDPATDTLSPGTPLMRGLGRGAGRAALPTVVGRQLFVTDRVDEGQVRVRRVSVGLGG